MSSSVFLVLLDTVLLLSHSFMLCQVLSHSLSCSSHLLLSLHYSILVVMM